jgi:hypothetical protein
MKAKKIPATPPAEVKKGRARKPAAAAKAAKTPVVPPKEWRRMSYPKAEQPDAESKSPTAQAKPQKDQIIERIANGEPLRAICRDSNMPAWRTVYDWIAADKEFAALIAHAREIGADAIAEEALGIADTPVEGVRVETGKDGRKEICEDMLGHRKLQVDTRLKLLAKWSPQKYGDRVALEHSGAIDLASGILDARKRLAK